MKLYAQKLINQAIMISAAPGMGHWYLARPKPYKSFLSRLVQAWDVIRYRADALYWEEWQ